MKAPWQPVQRRDRNASAGGCASPFRTCPYICTLGCLCAQVCGRRDHLARLRHLRRQRCGARDGTAWSGDETDGDGTSEGRCLARRLYSGGPSVVRVEQDRGCLKKCGRNRLLHTRTYRETSTLRHCMWNQRGCWVARYTYARRTSLHDPFSGCFLLTTSGALSFARPRDTRLLQIDFCVRRPVPLPSCPYCRQRPPPPSPPPPASNHWSPNRVLTRNLDFMFQLFNLAPFSALRSVGPFEAVLTPPVAVENVGRVAAAGALGLVPERGVLLVDDINRLAKDV